MKHKLFGSIFSLLIAMAVFFLVYSLMLVRSLTIWNIAFILVLGFFYYLFRIVAQHSFWRVLRWASATLLIFFSLVNFAHFKVFGFFVTNSSGFGRLPNIAEISLLIDYWSSIPTILYILSLLLVAYLAWFEFFWVVPKLTAMAVVKKRIFFLVTIFVFLILFIIPNFTPITSWYSVSRYHSDLGPIGYSGVETFQAILKSLDKSDKIYNKITAGDEERSEMNLQDVMEQLTVPSMNVPINIPDFESPPDVIVYQLESIGQWALDLEDSPMPYLKDLMSRSLTVDHFYANDCHTVGAEFGVSCSALSSSDEVIGNRLASLTQECLPSLLSDEYNYNTSVYHANVSSFWNRETLMPQLGYDNLYFSPLFTPRQYDGLVLEELLEKNKSITEPTFSYFIGYTSHGPHTDHFIGRNLRESNVVISPYQGNLPEIVNLISFPEEEMRNYFGFLTAVDQAIEGLFNNLEVSGELDNTIVIIYGDHRYYNFQEASGRSYQLYNELPFVMFVPGMEATHIPITASHIDITPTILDLLDKEHVHPTQYLGKSIFSPERHNYAFGKCGQEVYYFTGNTFVMGNQATDRYMTLSTNDEKADVKPERLRFVAKAAELSDQAWVYEDTFVIPDKTLVKGSGKKIYIIDGGQRRHIKEGKLIEELGYSWHDIHILSDEMLDRHPMGDPLLEVEAHLASNSRSEIEDESILRPSSQYPYKYYVAHAMGSAGGVTGCNCQAAFDEAYSKGYRLFEIDLALTVDEKIVLFHENEQTLMSDISLDQFIKLRYDGRFVLIDIDGLFELMDKYPDTYFITDGKEKFEQIIGPLVAKAQEKDPQLLERIIPQIYSPEQLALVNSLYQFPDIIYTLYMTEPSEEEVLKFLEDQESITAITARYRRYNDAFAAKLKEKNIALFVHTVNDKSAIQELIDNNVGVYTDAL